MDIFDRKAGVRLVEKMKYFRGDCGQIEVVSIKTVKGKPEMKIKVKGGKVQTTKKFEKESHFLFIGP